MIALDTNILVRLIARDDEQQTAEARRLVATNTCFLTDTVLVETAWVLRSSYGATRREILAEISSILGLPNIRVRNARAVRNAISWYAEGLDFEDAFHLATAQDMEGFVTFDQQFIQRADGKGVCPVIGPDQR